MTDTELDTRQQVPVQRVHSARTQQSYEVQGAPGLPEAGTEVHQGWKLVELSALYALGDPHQILRHHPPGTEVQVANLTVSHLPLGKPDRQAARIQKGPGKRAPQPVPNGRRCQLDRVALPLGPVAPAVQDHQDDPSPGASV